MELSLVFNELSIKLAPDQTAAKALMKGLVDMLKKAGELKINTFRSDQGFKGMLLANDYYIEQWFNDRSVNEADRFFLQDLASTFQQIQPIAADLSPSDEIISRHKNMFVQCNGKDGVGLAYACVMGALSVSLLSEKEWDTHYLKVHINELPDTDETANFIQTPRDLEHAATENHITSHQAWIEKHLKFRVGNGRDLENKLAIWYPHLIFCESAKRQIRNLKKGMPQLHRVITRLFELENYCKSWDEQDGFEISKIPNSSGESLSTMQHYGNDRRFNCPDGTARIFEYHLKDLPNVWRIHIWPDENAIYGKAEDGRRKVLVGYIGEHLATVKDPT